jgi:hypothetical protein
MPINNTTQHEHDKTARIVSSDHKYGHPDRTVLIISSEKTHVAINQFDIGYKCISMDQIQLFNAHENAQFSF